MLFSSALAELSQDAHPGSFEQIREAIDPEWIDAALHATGTASLRRRRLPAEQVLWLVLGMALYRDRSICDVAAALDLALPGKRGVTAASSSITEARQRLGEEPLAWLFRHTAAHWAGPSAARHRWRGLSLHALDGTCLRVADSPANRSHFGTLSGRRGEGAYPLVRLVALMSLRSHLIQDVRFGPCGTDEREYAAGLFGQLPPESLLVLDRNFVSAALLEGLRRDEPSRHWLVRARKNMRWEVLEELGPGQARVCLRISPEARRRDPRLPRSIEARAIAYQTPGGEPQVLLTSLLDESRYPGAELAGLYHERWEIELGYDEIKTHVLLQEESLRSQSPPIVAQEIWGLLLAYNLVRLEMERVAAEAQVAPTRISFTTTLHLIRDEWLWCAVANPGAIPRHLVRLRQELQRFILPPRRSERRFPRQVKRRQSKFPRKPPRSP